MNYYVNYLLFLLCLYDLRIIIYVYLLMNILGIVMQDFVDVMEIIYEVDLFGNVSSCFNIHNKFYLTYYKFRNLS